MELRVLERTDMYEITEERNKVMETLRTPFPLTLEQQLDYYDNVLCDRKGDTRYFGLYDEDNFVGYGGLEHIHYINHDAELSILIFDKYKNKGYGRKGVELFLDYGFRNLNLHTIHGECYQCANIGFWEKIIKQYNGWSTILPLRKFYDGRYWGSLYFLFTRCDYRLIT